MVTIPGNTRPEQPREPMSGADDAGSDASSPTSQAGRRIAKSFGEDPERYDRARPRYPRDLVDRARRVAEQAEQLRARAGQGDLADNLAEALTAFFGSVARHVLALVTFRDGLRARLRAAGVQGLPVLTEGTRMVAAYLDAERTLGRLPAGLDPDLKTLMLIGSAQLAFAERDHDGEPPSFSEVRRFVVEALGLT